MCLAIWIYLRAQTDRVIKKYFRPCVKTKTENWSNEEKETLKIRDEME